MTSLPGRASCQAQARGHHQGPGTWARGSCASLPLVGPAAPPASSSGPVSPARGTSCVGSNSSPKCSSRQQWKTLSWAIKYEAPEPQILPQSEVPDYLYTPMEEPEQTLGCLCCFLNIFQSCYMLPRQGEQKCAP